MKPPTSLLHLPIALLATTTLASRILNIVAHEDDDLLFMNPHILSHIASGDDIRTLFLTAGDAGLGAEYWTSRQAGSLAAYAEMAGVENTWEESDLGIPGRDIPLYTLGGRDQISLAFLHLPDGSNDGGGFPSTGQQSLEKLWKGSIGQIDTVDGSGAAYTGGELVDALVQVITGYGPDELNSQDFVDDFGSGDHSDHTAGALFVNEAAAVSGFADAVTPFEGYPVKNFPSNVDGEGLAAKKAAFYTYSAFDTAACASDQSCSATEYEAWLQREYPVN
ncbi:hypothetical protein BJY04DRAFT_211864 [Aspergillus karnatakaensis]|uniref:uncharacterized protein n=1 Tax=Aspergillus karnatakaensis TaxID=1810916 RepID=UPI003CCD73AB